MGKILVIRGGAIGDFILSLPTLKALKDALPETRLDILGYPQIAALARGRFYAEEVRSIDQAAFSRFFAAKAALPDDLSAWFAGYGQVISFLYDPDKILATNLERAGVRHLLQCPHRADDTRPEHATAQYARALERLAIYPTDFSPRLFPSDSDRAAAEKVLALHEPAPRLVALHPGSGGERKNWPAERWLALAEWLRSEMDVSLAIITGEAEEAHPARIERILALPGIIPVRRQELPTVAAVLARCDLFIGHDSGISHMASAVGAPVIALFGPTNPVVWAPVGASVLHRGPSPDAISLQDVQNEVMRILE